MPLILPGNVASATAGAYEVANSCRFNNDDSAYMHKTPGSASNRRTWTFSTWFKTAALADKTVLFSAGTSGSDETIITINAASTDKTLRCWQWTGSYEWHYKTSLELRDPSAWMHLVVAVDTTSGTEDDRIKIYINGTRYTGPWDSEVVPDQNQDTNVNNDDEHKVGNRPIDADYMDGYMAEVCLIDGTQYAASDFGEFDSDSPTIWKPKDVSGLTFGTNGFYLDFEASDNLGNDANGGTDLTEVNLDATDQATDTPTNNFCTMNPLDNYWPNSTFSEGNNRIHTQPGSGNATNPYYTYNVGTVWLTAGKWYCEGRLEKTAGTYDMCGIAEKSSEAKSHEIGAYANSWGYYGYDGKKENNATYTTYGDSYGVDGNIVGIYLDLDNNKLYFSINGTIQNSGTGITIAAAADVTAGAYAMAFGDNWNNAADGDSIWQLNFGATSFAGTAISSGNADANGYGNFEYDPSDGGNASFDGSAKDFLAICTKNLGSDGG